MSNAGPFDFLWSGLFQNVLFFKLTSCFFKITRQNALPFSPKRIRIPFKIKFYLKTISLRH
ncbi:MAG: hypothetical protein C4518_00330 [Desulfobacteraceae bacterium]|nr:MAG: hypothetical protein C4518_00330 [Desulfobacteraceae bacterium]